MLVYVIEHLCFLLILHMNISLISTLLLLAWKHIIGLTRQPKAAVTALDDNPTIPKRVENEVMS